MAEASKKNTRTGRGMTARSANHYSANDPQRGDNSQRRPDRGRRYHGGGNRNNQRGHNNNHRVKTEDCIICCQRSDVFGVGPCLHPACMECTIRMRCLGQQNTCHTCRAEVPVVTFVCKPPSWEGYAIPQADTRHPDCAKYNIAFQNNYSIDCYDSYCMFACTVCVKKGVFSEFPNFMALKQHVATHGLSYCHLCLDNLNVLTKDRALYNSEELKQHMEGERGRHEGFKGHPCCQFCKQRFYDDEAQYRHLRKDHFYCSLCDSEFGKNLFFNRMDQLHRHYKAEHHPCLHVDCLGLGIVFKSEMDLNVHMAQNHCGPNRSIPVDFQFNRNASRFGEASGRGTTISSSGGVSIVVRENSGVPRPQGVIIPSAQTSGRDVQIVAPKVAVQSEQFPSLGTSQTVQGNDLGWRSSVQASRSQRTAGRAPVSAQLHSASDFPRLSENNAPSTSAGSAWSRNRMTGVLQQEPLFPALAKVKQVPQLARKKFIPNPDVFPEGMRRKLEAREKGLSDPEEEDPPLPQPIEIKKKKEPKKKTVKAESVQHKLESGPSFASSSRFQAFSRVPGGEEVGNETWLPSTMKAKQKKSEKKKMERDKLQNKEDNKEVVREKLTLEKFREEKQKEEEEELKKAAEIEIMNKWDDEETIDEEVKKEEEEVPDATQNPNSQATNNDTSADPFVLLEQAHRTVQSQPQTVMDRYLRITSRESTSNRLTSTVVPPPPGFENVVIGNDISKPPGF